MRVIALCLALCLLSLASVATPTAAAPEPVGFCDDDATVDVCTPVCIQGPCYPYVCIHRGDDICVRL